MLASVISSIIVYGCAAILICRLISQSGIVFKNKYLSAASKDLRIRVPETTFKKKELICVFAAAFAFRIFMYIIQLMILYWFMNFPNIGQLNEFNGFWAKFLRQLEMWDGSNYFRIADGGYNSVLINGQPTMLVFFPLQSWTARILNVIFRNLRVSLLMTSTLSYCGGCTVLYMLTALDYGKGAAKKAAIYISLFPFSFFFGSMMAESILFFTMTLTFWFIRKHNWLGAGIAGAFAAMSRIVGILMIFAAAVEFIEYYKLAALVKGKKIKECFLTIVKNGLWLLIMASGIVVYLALNYRYTGNPFAFMEYQKTIWQHENCYFGQGIANIFSGLFPMNDPVRVFSILLPFASMLISSAVLVIYGLRRNRTMYSAFAIIYTVVICSLTWVPSGARYMTCNVPLFIILADFAERHKKADTLIVALFALLQGMYFIAYVNNMQIF